MPLFTAAYKSNRGNQVTMDHVLIMNLQTYQKPAQSIESHFGNIKLLEI